MLNGEFTEIDAYHRRYGWEKRRTITVAAGKRLCDEIDARADADKPSKMNKSITNRQAAAIFRAALAQIDGDDKPVKPLTARNIQRVAGVPKAEWIKP